MKYLLASATVLFLMSCQAQEQSEWAQWTKYPNNPVYTSADSGFAAADPSVFREGDTYYLYYTDVDNSVGATIISLATSKDGLEWSYRGRLLEVSKTSWDAALETAAIWKEEGKSYHLFYIGYKPNEYPPQGHYPADLGLAFADSPTGDFEKASASPVLTRSSGWYDSDLMASQDIIKVGETYYMIYVGHCYENCQAPVSPGVVIVGATSTDLIHWTKHKTPVLTGNPQLPWMAGYVAEPALLAGPNGKFYLFFTAFSSWEENTPTVIGVAEGDTPFGPWQINPEPVIIGTEGWEVAWTGAPDVLLEGDIVKLWYFGMDEQGFLKIGHATAPWPLRK
jgi:beta-xylosidase